MPFNSSVSAPFLPSTPTLTSLRRSRFPAVSICARTSSLNFANFSFISNLLSLLHRDCSCKQDQNFYKIKKSLIYNQGRKIFRGTTLVPTYCGRFITGVTCPLRFDLLRDTAPSARRLRWEFHIILHGKAPSLRLFLSVCLLQMLLTPSRPLHYVLYFKKSRRKSQYYFCMISLRNNPANRLICAPTSKRYIQKYSHIIMTTIVERLPYSPKSLKFSI